MAAVRRSRGRERGAAAGVVLTASLAVIAMAARAPLTRATPVDARAAAAPVTALYLLALGAGIVGLTALAVLIWPGRRRRGDDEPEPEYVEPEIHWLWKLLAVVAPFALGAALVAAVMFGVKATRHGAAAARPERAAPRLSGVTPARAVPGGPGFSVPAWLPWTVLGILAVGAVIAVVLMWWRQRAGEAIAARRRTPVAQAVQDALIALDSVEDPRAAVIAAYGAMQTTLAAHGVARRPAEAPREYLQRLLLASAAPEADARTLTGLFEEARFSTHPISEEVRRRAFSALGSIRAAITAPAP